MSIRTEKVAEEIKHQLAGILSRDLSELHLGLVTVTKVRISRDLKNAKMHLRYVPELDFYFDDNMEYASRIDEIIKEIHKEDTGDGDSSAVSDSNDESKDQ